MLTLKQFQETQTLCERLNDFDGKPERFFEYAEQCEISIDRNDGKPFLVIGNLQWVKSLDELERLLYAHHYFMEYGGLDILANAAKNPDPDHAIKSIQDSIGQDDGGFAGMFFDNESIDNWCNIPIAERHELLMQYAETEILNYAPGLHEGV